MERARECEREREREREMAIKKRAIRVGHSGKIVRVAVDGLEHCQESGFSSSSSLCPRLHQPNASQACQTHYVSGSPPVCSTLWRWKPFENNNKKKASSRRSAFVYIFMFIASSGPPLPCGKVRCATRAERTNWSVRVAGNMIVNDGRMKLAYTLRDQFTIRRWR